MPVLQRSLKAKTRQGLGVAALLFTHCAVDASRYVEALVVPAVVAAASSQKDDVRDRALALVTAATKRCRCVVRVGCWLFCTRSV